MYSIANRRHELTAALIKRRAPVNSKGDYLIVEHESFDSNGLNRLVDATALHIACHIGDLPEVDNLLKARATVDVKDNEGRTPLHIAVERGHSSVVARLIRAHCNVNLSDKNGNIALQEAAEMGNHDIYSQLKRAGATGDFALKLSPE